LDSDPADADRRYTELLVVAASDWMVRSGPVVVVLAIDCAILLVPDVVLPGRCRTSTPG
jgi:hypothetical protein